MTAIVERRRVPGAGRLLRLYYLIKYRLFARERRPRNGRRGLLALQIDALAYADLRRAMAQGFAPTVRRLLRDGDHRMRRWFCGLPSATPYCQAGIFHGENSGIPAFRFYDKALHRVITCNSPNGVQYIRDRLTAPGALAGGSSYVNLLDGDAQTVAFTVATRQRMSIYRRLGGTRMLLLIALHPVRVLRMVGQAAVEWLREEWERFGGELQGAHAYGRDLPLRARVHDVVVRELQTMAILLDLYLGVPIIYSTFMQYDEMAHHFGPRSRQAFHDLRRTDAACGRYSAWCGLARGAATRRHPLRSRHDARGSYRVVYGESIGSTVERILPVMALSARRNRRSRPSRASPRIPSTRTSAPSSSMPPPWSPARATARRRVLRRWRDWTRRHYGLREIIVPENTGSTIAMPWS